ncbi:MAG: beta-ketoacyl synthase [Proteobacteria bacterium]|nr:beta-ketoacyl synthase [Pseudomonadota bacterium]
MTRLPLIVGFGGVGPAGRSSFHHAYRRTIIESTTGQKRERTFLALASMMNLIHFANGQYADADGQVIRPDAVEGKYGAQILQGTLIRRIERNLFDPDRVPGNSVVPICSDNAHPGRLVVRKRDVPDPLPSGCEVVVVDDDLVELRVDSSAELRLGGYRKLAVQSAGQLPSGFDPAALYQSRFHPRGLQLTIIAASDAVHSVGIDWHTISQRVRPDEICVYAASAMGQLDSYGTGGMTQARLRGHRVSAKQLPLGLNQMPADFVNAYVLGNIGATGAAVGACATFLYNLRIAVDDIRSGRRRVAVVGNAEAPLLPEVIEGYAAMSALATDDNLCHLDGSLTPNYRRASRPFGENCGFVLSESGQYIVLFDDELALEMGAQIHGAVSDVFVNADGFKKSISAPGPGNYVTLAKAVAATRAILGNDAIRNRSFIQAHGSSTPQNRTTESLVFDHVARAFGITQWPVTAMKGFVGHSLAPASADQMISSLGVFRDEILPGIKTLDAVADDVYDERLTIPLADLDLRGRADVAFLNSKGFGGNNATAAVFSPGVAQAMLLKRYGAERIRAYQDKLEVVTATANEYDERCMHGPMQPIYRFGESMIDEEKIEIDGNEIRLPGFKNSVDLQLVNHYDDMV